MNKPKPSWVATGVSRPETMTPEMQQFYDKLDERIREEAGEVVTRPVVERLVPRRGVRNVGSFVVVTANGLSIAAGVRHKIQPLGERRCHIEIDHAEKVVRIIIAPDGPWRFPTGTQTHVGGKRLRDELVDRGLKPGVRYPATVRGNVVEASFGKEAKRRAG